MDTKRMEKPEILKTIQKSLDDKMDLSFYGGYYFSDDLQTLHINLVDGKENFPQMLGKLPRDGSVVFHSVKHSMEELTRMKEAVRTVAME